MGEFLSKPNKKKQVMFGMSEQLRYCSVEMQGWRRSMEDTNMACLDLGDGNSFFGVFDGHGGIEVAKYVRKYLVKELCK
jgi:protein phosphatase 1G